MHVPDGFIAPQVYIPSYLIAIGLWTYGIKQVKNQLTEETLPYVAVLTAFSFALSMIAIPLPGGTSVHACGIGILAILFGIWTSFIAISMVLILQAFLFGDGGITALPVNALAMGLAGTFTAVWIFKILRRFGEKTALVIAGWLSLVLPAAMIATVLGIQPWIAHQADGTPLFFPFGLTITLPAVLIPHAIIGIGEGLLTYLIYEFSQKRLNRLVVS